MLINIKANVMRLIGVSIILCGVLFCSSCRDTKKEMSIKEMVESGAVIVDVRSPQEYAEGSVEGAVNIPLSVIPREVERLRNESGVVLYCSAGKRSGQAKKILEDQGVKNVMNGINVETIESSLQR